MTMYYLTGASGFVGKNLVNTLQKKAADYIILSRQNTGRGDIDQYILETPVASNAVLVHLAARVHVMEDAAENPMGEFLASNVDATISLAMRAAAAGIKRFIYVSSVKVNGEYTNKKSFTERDIPDPQDPYAISKWQAEQALQQLSVDSGMEIVIIRPPLVYGPNVKANFFKLLSTINRNIPLPLGSISNNRSMVYVGNLVDAIIKCSTHKAAAGQTYLVSDYESLSTPELIGRLANALDKPDLTFKFPIALIRFFAALFRKSAAVDRLTQSLMIDSSKIRSELNWEPPYTLEQGLKETANWYHHIGKR